MYLPDKVGEGAGLGKGIIPMRTEMLIWSGGESQEAED